MKFSKAIFLIGCLASLSLLAPVKAAGEGISVAPSKVVMQINDFGKNYTFKITNSTNNKLDLVMSEGLVSVSDDGATAPIDKEVTKTFLEFTNGDKLSVAPNATAEAKLRTKIVANNSTSEFPALIIKQDTNKAGTIGVNYEVYVPFITQNTSGNLSMDDILNINVTNYAFSPDLTITGSIENNGTKFFQPSGTVVILKDGVKIEEKEITSQLAGYLFPGQTKSYEVKWTNPDTSFQAAGEYTVETHLSNDLSDKTSGSRIKFIYVPKLLVYTAGGVVGGLIALIAVFNIIRFTVSKVKKNFNNKV